MKDYNKTYEKEEMNGEQTPLRSVPQKAVQNEKTPLSSKSIRIEDIPSNLINSKFIHENLVAQAVSDLKGELGNKVIDKEMECTSTHGVINKIFGSFE